jgi:hypothetical protein
LKSVARVTIKSLDVLSGVPSLHRLAFTGGGHAPSRARELRRRRGFPPRR